MPRIKAGWVAAAVGVGSGVVLMEAAGARATEIVMFVGWVVGGRVRMMEDWVVGMVGADGAVVWERAVDSRSRKRIARSGNRSRLTKRVECMVDFSVVSFGRDSF